MSLGNGRFDCADDSSGGRTAGTADTWANNTGEEDSPPGICNP